MRVTTDQQVAVGDVLAVLVTLTRAPRIRRRRDDLEAGMATVRGLLRARAPMLFDVALALALLWNDSSVVLDDRRGCCGPPWLTGVLWLLLTLPLVLRRRAPELVFGVVWVRC